MNAAALQQFHIFIKRTIISSFLWMCCFSEESVIISFCRQFLPARRCASAGLCDSDVFVRTSVRHTPVLCLAERKQDREMYTI